MRLYEGGPIPFDKILWYSVEILCLDSELADIFTSVVREMDMVYQNWMAKERDKGTSRDRPKAPSHAADMSAGSSRRPRRRR